MEPNDLLIVRSARGLFTWTKCPNNDWLLNSIEKEVVIVSATGQSKPRPLPADRIVRWWCPSGFVCGLTCHFHMYSTTVPITETQTQLVCLEVLSDLVLVLASWTILYFCYSWIIGVNIQHQHGEHGHQYVSPESGHCRKPGICFLFVTSFRAVVH